MSDDEHWAGKTKEPWGGWYLVAGDTPDVVLARIDERTKNLDRDVTEIKTLVKEHYVTADQFKNLKDKVDLHQKILFTVIGLLCLSVLGAMFKLVIMPGPPV